MDEIGREREREAQILWEEPGKVQEESIVSRRLSKESMVTPAAGTTQAGWWDLFQGIMRAQEWTCWVYDAREHYGGCLALLGASVSSSVRSGTNYKMVSESQLS